MNVLIPSMTTQIVLSAFEYLVNMELLKGTQSSFEFRNGCQEGMIATLILMFGSASDEAAEEAYEKQETWMHLSQRIVDEKLNHWTQVIANNEDYSPDVMDFEVKNAVQEFAKEHPTLLINALKVYL